MGTVWSELFNAGPQSDPLGPGNTSICTSALSGGAGATAIFDSAQKKEGSFSAHFQGTAAWKSLEYAGASTDTSRYFSYYIFPVANPSGNLLIHYCGHSALVADRTAQVVLNSAGTSGPTLKIQNNAAAIIGQVTGEIPRGEWSRIDWSIVGSTVTLEVYPGNAHCDDPVGTALSIGSVNTVNTAGAYKQTGSTTPPATTPLAYQTLGPGGLVDNNLYIDAFRADNAVLPGPLTVPPQYLAPATDIAVTDWTVTGGTGTFASAIDEASADDVDYVSSPANPVNSYIEWKFAAATDPLVSTGHSISYRVRVRSAATYEVVAALRQGASTVIASETRTTGLTTSFQTFTLSLTPTEADNITDYSDLRLRVTVSAAG